MRETENKLARDEILDTLRDLKITEQIEIMANVMISIGYQVVEDEALLLDYDIARHPEHLMSFLAKYKKQNGETLEGALMTQGVTMMMWIDRMKERV